MYDMLKVFTLWTEPITGNIYCLEIHSCIYVGLLNSVDLKRFKHISAHSQKQTQYIVLFENEVHGQVSE